MSDRPCNLCDFTRRQRDAKKARKTLKLVCDGEWTRVMVRDIGAREWRDAEVLYKLVPKTCEC